MITQGKRIAARREFAVSGRGRGRVRALPRARWPTCPRTSSPTSPRRTSASTPSRTWARATARRSSARKLAQIFRNTPYRHARDAGARGRGAARRPRDLHRDHQPRGAAAVAGDDRAPQGAARGHLLGGGVQRACCWRSSTSSSRTRCSSPSRPATRCARRTSATTRSSSAASRRSTSRRARALGAHDRRGDHAHLAVPRQPAPLRRRRPPRGLRPGAPERPRRGASRSCATSRRSSTALLDIEQVVDEAGPEAPAARLHRRGGDGPPLPAAPGREPLRLARSCAATPRCGARASPSTRSSAAILAAGLAWGGWNVVARRSRPREADAARRAAAERRSTASTRRSRARLPSLRRGRLDDARRGHVLQRLDPPLPDAHRLPARRSRRCCARIPSVRLHAALLAGHRRPEGHAADARHRRRAQRAAGEGARQGGERPPPPAAAEDAANPPFAGGRYEVALLEATVRVAEQRLPRRASTEVEQLADDIGALAGLHAPTWSRARSTCAPRCSCRAATPSASRATMEPRFVLRIVRDRGGAA